ncbi:hypothetical protein [Paenibacillus sp. FSL K6-2524]
MSIDMARYLYFPCFEVKIVPEQVKIQPVARPIIQFMMKHGDEAST